MVAKWPRPTTGHGKQLIAHRKTGVHRFVCGAMVARQNTCEKRGNNPKITQNSQLIRLSGYLEDIGIVL